MEQIIGRGTIVSWSGAWGHEVPKLVNVTGIEYCPNGGKYGTPVDTIPYSQKDECIFTLSSGNWCYGYQINGIYTFMAQ